MRNYEATYELMKQLKDLALDEAVFAQSEKDRLSSYKIVQQVQAVFPQVSETQLRGELSNVFDSTYLAQFFDFYGKRFFIDLPHIRIFAYVYECLGKNAPNEGLADFAVHMAKIAQEHISYSNPVLAQVINNLANQ